jgi:hypothetical protein
LDMQLIETVYGKVDATFPLGISIERAPALTGARAFTGM